MNPTTLRVRRHRERRREGVRLVTVEVPERVIEAATARGLLKPEDCAEAWGIIEACHASLLSDKALGWLVRNGVIASDQRADAVAILRSVSDWLERAP